jgi:hypothetical protein
MTEPLRRNPDFRYLVFGRGPDGGLAGGSSFARVLNWFLLWVPGGWHTLKSVRTFLTSVFDVRVAHPLRHAKGGVFRI